MYKVFKNGKERLNEKRISYEAENVHAKHFHFGTVLTWHTNAVKTTNLIKASGIVLAWVRLALVHVHFAAWPLIALEALTLERALGVQTPAAMLTWIGPWKNKQQSFDSIQFNFI